MKTLKMMRSMKGMRLRRTETTVVILEYKIHIIFVLFANVCNRPLDDLGYPVVNTFCACFCYQLG